MYPFTHKVCQLADLALGFSALHIGKTWDTYDKEATYLEGGHLSVMDGHHFFLVPPMACIKILILHYAYTVKFLPPICVQEKIWLPPVLSTPSPK